MKSMTGYGEGRGKTEEIDLLLEVNEASMEQVSRVIHGTTLVANAVIERNGA